MTGEEDLQNTWTFEEAVDVARTRFRQETNGVNREGLSIRPFNSPGGFEDMLLTLKALEAFEEDKVEALVKASERNADAFNALRLGIAYYMSEGKKIPREAELWLAAYLYGSRESPPKKKTKDRLLWWHLLIYITVDELVCGGGLRPTRNDQKTGQNHSACDAVAEALKSLQLTPRSYSGVKSIWIKINKRGDIPYNAFDRVLDFY